MTVWHQQTPTTGQIIYNISFYLRLHSRGQMEGAKSHSKETLYVKKNINDSTKIDSAPVTPLHPFYGTMCTFLQEDPRKRQRMSVTV